MNTYKQGYRAYEEFREQAENPYTKGTTDYTSWAGGYEECRKEFDHYAQMILDE